MLHFFLVAYDSDILNQTIIFVAFSCTMVIFADSKSKHYILFFLLLKSGGRAKGLARTERESNGVLL
jgi:hypothetical protein